MEVNFHLRTASDLGTPTNTSGSLRPLMLMDRPYHTVHYTGIRPDQVWFSGGDGVFDSIDAVYQFVRRLEEVARRAGKPFEYNTIIPVMADGSAHVLAYADEYVAAHSAGENTLAHGTLLATGVGQDLNDGAILAFRWWNAVLRTSGRLSKNSTITPHNQMPGAATGCPGVNIINRLPELRTPYVEEAPPEQPLQGVPDMFHPVQPFRNSDTRAFGGEGLPAGDHVFGLNVPKEAVAVAINVTMVNPKGAGFITVWPSGSRPNTSCLNFDGSPGATSNSVIVGVSDQGGLSIYNSVTGHLIVDVTGYWTP